MKTGYLKTKKKLKRKLKKKTRCNPDGSTSEPAIGSGDTGHTSGDTFVLTAVN